MAICVALAVLIAGGGIATWLLTGDDDSKGDTAAAGASAAEGSGGTGPSGTAKPPKAPRPPIAPSRLEEAWTTPREQGDSLQTHVGATWHAGSTYFVGRGTGIKMFDLASGRQTGTVAPPAPGLSVCAMTPGLNKDGLGAVAWLKDTGDVFGECSQVSVVDARNGGRILWTAGFAGTKRDGSPYSTDEAALGFVGDDLVAAMTPTSVVALRVSDHSEAWTWRNRTTTSRVLNIDMLTTPDLVAVMTNDESDVDELVTVDSGGRQIGAQPTPIALPDKQSSADLVSAAPLAVLITPYAFDDTTQPSVALFDRGGALTKTVRLTTDTGQVSTDYESRIGRDKEYPLLFTPTRVYATTESPAPERARSMVAFDLANGAEVWSQPIADSARSLLVQADEDTVYALNASYSAAELMSYAAEDGKPTVVSTVVPKPDNPFSVLGATAEVVDGRLLVTETRGGSFGTLAFAGAS